ncbi:MAG TPA: efflux RND transporter periplasmic adaptor subunit [Thermoanaerobaculia bacterium]
MNTHQEIRSTSGPRWSIAVLAVALLLSVLLGWLLRRPAATAEPSGERPAADRATSDAVARVDAFRVRRAGLSLRAEATGYLEPWKKVEVRSEASGRVVARQVEEGGRVGAGDLLVRLDDRDRVLELAEARAEWLRIQAGWALDFGRNDEPRAAAASSPLPAGGEEELRRAERLLREGVISRQELDETRRRLEAARILSGEQRGEIRAASTGLAQAEQKVERARLALERTRILAPFAGRIADLAVESGQHVTPGDPLLTLMQDDRLKVDVGVLEADIVRVREGGPARVRIPSADGLELQGTVYTVNPKVEPGTGTGRVTVAIPNPRGLLLAGLFATVELEVGRLADRLLVPAAALLERQGRTLVFRIENGRALWTWVKTGARSGDLVEIVEGLSEGDVIAIGGHFALAHEAPVEAVLTAAVPGAAAKGARP